MAAPEHVRIHPTQTARNYESPDHVPGPWSPVRAGDLEAGQPVGELFGSQGPDQGYALRLVRVVRPKLQLAEGENAGDVEAGLVALALRRASLYGRAPVVHDLMVAAGLWGFLDGSPPADLVAERRRRFLGLANPHHYVEARELATSIPEASLRSTPDQARQLARGWREALGAEAHPAA